MATRKEKMDSVKNLARTAHQRGDVVARRQAADTWYELATRGEADRAPKYLTWTGR